MIVWVCQILKGDFKPGEDLRIRKIQDLVEMNTNRNDLELRPFYRPFKLLFNLRPAGLFLLAAINRTELVWRVVPPPKLQASL